ncbi:hypothetical protein ACH4YO_13845 [Streptomyces noursei]|uniref:hypothetical protein n=1 Tax=Streptomyces noursei TaxID=1971 RepID=UPI0033EF7D55
MKHGPLTAARCAAPQPPVAASNGEHMTLSDQDHALPESLAEDGRVGFAPVVAAHIPRPVTVAVRHIPL